MAPCMGPFFSVLTLDLLCRLECLGSSIPFLWSRGWLVMEYLQAPELDMPVTSLAQAVVPWGLRWVPH